MRSAFKNYLAEIKTAWNRFWFAAQAPQTLCLIRIFAGSMMLYTHLVWTLELPAFYSSDGVFNADYRKEIAASSSFAWSHFGLSGSPAWMWGSHIGGLIVLLLFTIGLWTRVTSIGAFLIVVSYAHHASGALFGLDQINAFLAMYLAVGPSGQCYSVDAWRRSRDLSCNAASLQAPTVMANIAVRLIQVHLCVVYLFAGMGKLQGATWWNGTAIWGALASYEYQTVDMTWLSHLPWVVNGMTMISVFWELSYPFLIWHRLTRPICLALAVIVHLGIGLTMGMMTFGLVMLIANCAFLNPQWVSDSIENLRKLAGQNLVDQE